MKYEISEPYEHMLNDLSTIVHQCNLDAGWWQDLYEVLDMIDQYDGSFDYILKMKERVRMWFVLSKVSLIHSEISEMVEGIRKRTMDSHLPHREADEVEAGDTLIRLFDLCGHLGLDIGGATGEKFLYNQERADHKKDAREGEGGKLV